MTATAKPTVGADTNGDPATVGGGITRLNATDGLFLRAEHLIAMQDYARELAFAAGLANGTGIVYGFTVSLCGDTLEVAPGLAVDPIGRPLRSRRTAVVSLSDPPAVGDDGFWIVEIVPAQWVYGTENVYGNLCDDPCDGSVIAPWQAEGITVRLRPDTMPGLDVQTSAKRRNWLASQYFGRERQRGGPWLTPAQPGGVVSSIIGRDWSEGTPEPAAAGVPIAVVQRSLDATHPWVLDVWTARREVGDPPARRTWQWRLAMRPCDVFLAQVLQFQNQLAASVSGTVQAKSVDPRSDLIEDLEQIVQGMAVKPKKLRAVVEALSKATPAAIGPSLFDQGFGELSPAGLLQIRREDLDSSVKALFGPNVDVRICHCRADYVPKAIEQAQHLDRIPLDVSDPKPQVDVLVPDWPADLDALKVDDYGWVAFVRRQQIRCEDKRPVDHVDVYLAKVGFDSAVVDQLRSVDRPSNAEFQFLGTLTYPADTWAYPGGEIVEQIPFLRHSGIVLAAITNTDQRRPLAALRATLFADSFDRGLTDIPVHAIVSQAATREMIVIFQVDIG